MSKKISDCVPDIGLNLSNYSGTKVIEKIGEDVIKEVVSSVLLGDNIRALTEGLTRRRLCLSNAAMLVTFLKASANIDEFIKNMPTLIKKELLAKNVSKDKKIFLQWMLGLTGKSVQNVLRSDPEAVNEYLNAYEKAIKECSNKNELDLGIIEGIIKINDVKSSVNWPFLMYLFAAIGTQTLAIRGSEKSMYGKLFERLILGSLLEIFDFEKIDPCNTEKVENVFWLSSRGDKRESDATLLYKRGVGVRFDIGFIGPGNTEISLDKVSRFERDLEIAKKSHFMHTIIIVDRIGSKSRIVEMAKAIDGSIVQMSMSYWVKEIAQILKEKIGFDHKILTLSDRETADYIKTRMKSINLNQFINNCD